MQASGGEARRAGEKVICTTGRVLAKAFTCLLFHNRTLLFSVRKLQSESLGITEAAPSCAIPELPPTRQSDNDEAFALARI
jgi:hypothetical protein